MLLLLAVPGIVAAQTDYHNTDSRRPLVIEDAYATERYAFELQLAPLRLERAGGGRYVWEVEPEVAYGILPRTHLEIGLPLVYADGGPGARRSGVAGLDVSVLHNLNAESRGLPALGISAHVRAPVGGLAPERTYSSLKGIVTRTFTPLRVHINGQYTFGSEPATGSAGETGEVDRWMAGVALDRSLPLRSMLIGGEVFATQPIHPSADVTWNVGAGVRYQVDPYFAFDAGIGRRLTGDERAWFVTFGLARAFAIRALMPR